MKNILKVNPELAKNIWLELSPQRLVTMPAILLLFVFLIFSLDNGGENPWETIHYFSFYGFIIIGILWGMKSSSDAILDEYNEKTWDWQKMSSIGPWKLAVGKLFGAPIYNWYGATICWMLFMYSATYTKQPIAELKTGFLLVALMIGLHGLMILISLQLIRRTNANTKIKSSRIFLSGLLFAGLLSGIFSYLTFFDNGAKTQLSWFGWTLPMLDFLLFATIVYVFWILAGLYRSMRTELQFTDSPDWWLFFLLFHSIFQYGFFVSKGTIVDLSALSSNLTLLFVETMLLTYLLALSENKDIVIFRKLIHALKSSDYRTFSKNVPLWLVTLPIAKISGLVVLVLLFFVEENAFLKTFLRDYSITDKTEFAAFYFAILLFVLRDLGILLLLNFSNRPQRADTSMLVYLVLIYLILPTLTSGLGISVILYPDITQGIIPLIGFPMVEAIAVVYFLIKKWQEISLAYQRNS
jgi:hypothetical protein